MPVCRLHGNRDDIADVGLAKELFNQVAAADAGACRHEATGALPERLPRALQRRRERQVQERHPPLPQRRPLQRPARPRYPRLTQASSRRPSRRLPGREPGDGTASTSRQAWSCSSTSKASTCSARLTQPPQVGRLQGQRLAALLLPRLLELQDAGDADADELLVLQEGVHGGRQGDQSLLSQESLQRQERH